MSGHSFFIMHGLLLTIILLLINENKVKCLKKEKLLSLSINDVPILPVLS